MSRLKFIPLFLVLPKANRREMTGDLPIQHQANPIQSYSCMPLSGQPQGCVIQGNALIKHRYRLFTLAAKGGG